MDNVMIESKKYVLLSIEEYETLRKRAASKFRPNKKFTIAEARLRSKKLIREWAGVQ